MSHHRTDEDVITNWRAADYAAQSPHSAIIETLPLAILVCDEGTIRFANTAARSLFGAPSADEFCSRDFLHFVQPQDRDAFIVPLNGKRNGAGVNSSHLARLMRLDGTEFIAEVSVRREAENDATYILIHPTNEQRFLDDSLRQSEEKYRTLVEESLDAMVLLSIDGRILEANNASAQLFGVANTREVIGRNLHDDFCVQPQQRELLVQALQRQGFIRNFEYEVRRGENHKRRVLEHATAVHDTTGRIVAARSTLRDITEWKHLEQQLFQAQKMESMTALIGGIGHDFINVLNNVQGFAAQLKKYSDEPAKVQKYAETITKSVERGLGLASQLLSFVKPKKKAAASANVADVVAEIVELVRETFPNNIHVSAFVEEHELLAAIDAGDFYQALMNVCLNARDAMPTGGTLHIEATRGNPEETRQDNTTFVKIRISDSGSGIPAAIRDRVFDPFFTTKERGKGLGLGLSIVYNIVKTNKGTITVESEENRGTTFTLFFPLVVARQTPSIAEVHHQSGKPNNELILLADDEQMMQELGRELLQEQGYRVIVARDGVEAVELYRRHANDISLVVLDLLMPRLDGGQTYLELKKINPSVRAFFCTGFAPGEMIGSLLESESLIALQKPFRPEEFLFTVREVLSSN